MSAFVWGVRLLWGEKRVALHNSKKKHLHQKYTGNRVQPLGRIVYSILRIFKRCICTLVKKIATRFLNVSIAAFDFFIQLKTPDLGCFQLFISQFSLVVSNLTLPTPQQKETANEIGDMKLSSLESRPTSKHFATDRIFDTAFQVSTALEIRGSLRRWSLDPNKTALDRPHVVWWSYFL